MSHESREEFLWNAHAYVNEHIRFADTKAELVIGWTSALIGALMAGGFHRQFTMSVNGVAALAGFLALVLAFACAFAVVIPRLSTTQPMGFIFWRSVLAHKTNDAFVKALAELSEPSRAEHIAGHLYDLSGICDKKFRWVNWSVCLAFGGSLLSGFMYLIATAR